MDQRLRGLVFVAAIGVLGTGCGGGDEAPYVRPFFVTTGIVDTNGVAVAFASLYPGDNETEFRHSIAVFGDGPGCKGVTRDGGRAASFEPMWRDDQGFVVRRSSVSGEDFIRIGNEGGLTTVAPSGELPKPEGSSAPRFVFDRGTIFELDGRGSYAARPAARALEPLQAFGVDQSGRSYAFGIPPSGSIGGKSLAPKTSTAAPDVPTTGELRAASRDDAVLFRAPVAAGTNFVVTRTTVASGGAVVIDRNNHLKRYAADGGTIYDVDLGNAFNRITASPNGGVAVGFGGTGFPGAGTVARYSPDGKQMWTKTFGEGDARVIQVADDGRTFLLGTQTSGERRDIIRQTVDSSSGILARDVCSVD